MYTNFQTAEQELIANAMCINCFKLFNTNHYYIMYTTVFKFSNMAYQKHARTITLLNNHRFQILKHGLSETCKNNCSSCNVYVCVHCHYNPFDLSLILFQYFKELVLLKHTKGNNSTQQTRDTTTKT